MSRALVTNVTGKHDLELTLKCKALKLDGFATLVVLASPGILLRKCMVSPARLKINEL